VLDFDFNLIQGSGEVGISARLTTVTIVTGPAVLCVKFLFIICAKVDIIS